jgi:hypothetical protein
VIVNGKADNNKKSCYDCLHCEGGIGTWWCKNKEAAQYRGTYFAGVIKCPFWERTRYKYELSFFEKYSDDFIIEIEGLIDDKT